MKLSEDRISHLSHLVLNHLIEEGFVFITEDKEPSVRSRVKKIFTGKLENEDALDERVRKKIASYQRKIPEGSNEWHILYQRFYQEEKSRKGSM